jgi:hypothetical protein
MPNLLQRGHCIAQLLSSPAQLCTVRQLVRLDRDLM